MLLIEADPDYGARESERWPLELLDAAELTLSHDWGIATTLPSGRRLPLERARVMGGCSSHNGCQVVIGYRRDYDAWAEAGNRGWATADELTPLASAVLEAFAPEWFFVESQKTYRHPSSHHAFRRDQRPSSMAVTIRAITDCASPSTPARSASRWTPPSAESRTTGRAIDACHRRLPAQDLDGALCEPGGEPSRVRPSVEARLDVARVDHVLNQAEIGRGRLGRRGDVRHRPSEASASRSR